MNDCSEKKERRKKVNQIRKMKAEFWERERKTNASVWKGSGWIRAVERMPRDREVVGLNPPRCWAFLFSSLSYQYCVLSEVPYGGATLLIFHKKDTYPCSLRVLTCMD